MSEPLMDYDDPLVAEMVRRNRHPKESWIIRGGESQEQLATLHCDMCKGNWPCTAISQLREHEARKARNK